MEKLSWSCKTPKLEAKDRMEAIDGIKRGLESMKRGAAKPAETFFQELFAAEGIPEHE